MIACTVNKYLILLTFTFCLFAAIAQQKPFSVEPYFNRNLSQHQRDSLNNRIREYSLFIEKDSFSVLTYFNRGVTYTELGLHQKAYSDFSKVIQLDSTVVAAYYNRSLCRMKYAVTQDACMDLHKAALKGLEQASVLFNEKCAMYKDSIQNKSTH